VGAKKTRLKKPKINKKKRGAFGCENVVGAKKKNGSTQCQKVSDCGLVGKKPRGPKNSQKRWTKKDR